MTYSAAILNTLRDLGDMTGIEIARHLGMSQQNAASYLSRLMRRDEVHISGYVYDHPGARSYPRALYRSGQGKNKAKPRPVNKGGQRQRVRLDQGAVLRGSSVFRLSMSREQIRRDAQMA